MTDIITLAAIAAIPVTVGLVLRYASRTQVVEGVPAYLREKQMTHQHNLENQQMELQQQILAERQVENPIGD